jgi:hypothetical protein
LLTPDPALVASRTDLRALPGVRFARLWQRGALGADMNNLVGLRGAGSFLSFATGIQDYDHEPDIELDYMFQSGFYGGTAGLVVRLDATRLGDVVDEHSVRPSSVSPETWETLWHESKVDERSIPAVYAERIRKAAESTRAVVGLGDSYLVRSVMPGEHDLVAAFQVIGRDDKSATIAWRVLKLWETPRHQQLPRPDPLAGIPAPPDSLRNLSTEQLTQRHGAISQRAQHMILDMPKDLDPAWSRFASLTNGGLARIAERSRWDSLLSVDGGGAYWSFTSRSNDYQHDAQIELQQARFSSGFAGRDRGYVLDLGESPLDQITLGGPPHGSAARVEEAHTFMRDLEPVPMSAARSDLEISEEDNERAASLGVLQGAPAVVGHSYLVRSVITGRVDVLAAFQVLARDEMALTIAWKILRQKPASR